MYTTLAAPFHPVHPESAPIPFSASCTAHLLVPDPSPQLPQLRFPQPQKKGTERKHWLGTAVGVGTPQTSAPVAARWLQTHGHARRSQSRGTRGRGRAQAAGSQPPRLKTPGAQSRAEPWRLRLPFSLSAELRRDSGTGPKKEQEILFTARGEEPIEPLFGKSASPAPAAMCSW